MQPDDAAPAAGGTASGRSGRPPSPLLALEFLTVARPRRPAIAPADDVARSQLWYPAVGLLIGLAVAGLDRLLFGRLPAAPEAVLLVILLEGLTGLLHLDGLADSADGLLGLHARERRLEIMRDSRTGAFGVASVALYLLLAYAAISALTQPVRTAALISAPVIGRGAMVIVMAGFRNARADGLAAGFHEIARSWIGAVATLSTVAIATLVLGAGGIALFLAGTAAAVAVAAFARTRLGGVTGDVIGATCELAQVTSLTLAAALQSHGWAHPWL